MGEGQRAQQDGVDHTEDGDVGADAEGQDEDGDETEGAVAAEGCSEDEAEISKGINQVVSQTAASVHVLSYALANALDGENISKLTFGLFAGIFATPAFGDKVVNLGFKVKVQLIFHVCRRIGTRQAVVSPP
jgi:hypothetical protein